MWIFDSYFKGCVELWSRERGLDRISTAYPLSFYMYLKDPHAHWEMIEALESRYRVEECSFNTIFGYIQGHRIYASRKVAEKIEKQTRYTADLHKCGYMERPFAPARHNVNDSYMQKKNKKLTEENMKQIEIDKIYREMHAGDIPWNIETPPKALVELIESGKVKPAKTIDLGCGAGNYAIYLASKGFDVTGVDISPTAIKMARENAMKKGVKSNFIVADVLGDLNEVKGDF